MTIDYLILAGGRPPPLGFVKLLIKHSKNIITVDRGAQLALKLKIRPLIHVGDGDSFSFSKLKNLKANTTLRLPQKKPISDLEYLLNHIEEKKTKLILCAHNDFEGRSDHAFLNMIILSERKNIYYADEKMWMTRLNPKKQLSFCAPLKTIFSIAALGDPHKNKISISGAAYSVKNTSFKQTTQGLSNFTNKKWTKITASRPALLFVSSNIIYTKIDDSRLI